MKMSSFSLFILILGSVMQVLHSGALDAVGMGAKFVGEFFDMKFDII